MKDSGCQGDLISRKRRGLSSPGELAEAAEHLSACESCRLVEQVGADFDDTGELMPGDDERIARFARAAASAAQNLAPAAAPRAPESLRPKRARLFAALPLAAAFLLVAAVAAAAGAWFVAHSKQSAPHAVVPTGSSVALPALAPSLAASPSAPPPAHGSHEGPATVSPPEAPAADAPPEPQVSSPSAEQLFTAGNEARRSGNTAQAITLYQRLQRSFAASPQAQASSVSLGRLLLDRGSASAALSQFSRYLAGSDRTLRMEALSGRARSLKALGKSSEERAAWQALLNEYPSSVYAEVAKKRLAELP